MNITNKANHVNIDDKSCTYIGAKIILQLMTQLQFIANIMFRVVLQLEMTQIAPT